MESGDSWQGQQGAASGQPPDVRELFGAPRTQAHQSEPVAGAEGIDVEAQRRRVKEEYDAKLKAHRTSPDERRARRKSLVAALVVVVAVGAATVWSIVTVPHGGGNSASRAASSGPQASVPPPDRSASKLPLGIPVPPLGTGPYEFFLTQKNSKEPVAWDPCRPIRYVVNADGAPPGAAALLSEAVRRTSAATGLKFRMAGSTSERWTKERDLYQPKRYGKRWAPALITWSTQEQTPALAGYIAGFAQPIPVVNRAGDRVYVSGSVVLDSEDLGRILAEPDGDARARSVIQHELGHLVGLDHVADATQLMYSEGTEFQAGDWGEGDRRGLFKLGTGRCFADL